MLNSKTETQVRVGASFTHREDLSPTAIRTPARAEGTCHLDVQGQQDSPRSEVRCCWTVKEPLVVGRVTEGAPEDALPDRRNRKGSNSERQEK